jgi:hypothetical protein
MIPMRWSAVALAIALAACTQPAATSASAAAPGALAAYEGTWNGTWDGKLPITLVVDRVTPPTARIIYEWGIFTAEQINNPGFIRGTAHFEGDRMVTRLPSGATAIYVLQQDGTLAGIAGGTVGGTVLGPNPPTSGVIHATLTRQ